MISTNCTRFGPSRARRSDEVVAAARGELMAAIAEAGAPRSIPDHVHTAPDASPAHVRPAAGATVAVAAIATVTIVAGPHGAGGPEAAGAVQGLRASPRHDPPTAAATSTTRSRRHSRKTPPSGGPASRRAAAFTTNGDLDRSRRVGTHPRNPGHRHHRQPLRSGWPLRTPGFAASLPVPPPCSRSCRRRPEAPART